MVSSPPIWQPKTEADREAVLAQLGRLLAHAAFRQSKRYPKLLRYLVEYSVLGNSEHLKERTIGVDVFGREADYDTNEDPIVRVAAGEVRKKIAQYYHEPGHEHELRIELHQFSYVPVFQLPEPESAALSQVSPSVSSPEVPELRDHARRRWPSARLWSVSILTITACLGLVWVRSRTPHSASEDFWKPLLAAQSPIIVAVGTPEFARTALDSAPSSTDVVKISPDPSSTGGQQITTSFNHVAFPDVYAVSLVSGLLGQQNKLLEVRDASTLNFTDLQNGPAVMIGSFNNPWTLRATSNLRFHFVIGPSNTWIADARNPAAQNWSVDRTVSISQWSRDYGIVARFIDRGTNQPTIVAAGLGATGTVAAAQLLTDPRYASLFSQGAPAGWSKKNIEIVLSTEVIGAKTGPPRIVATEYW